jgi:two-component system, chemotaxis family, sensor kinase CheA
MPTCRVGGENAWPLTGHATRGFQVTEKPLNELDAIVREFIVESNENLDQLNRDLVELEKHPKAKDTLASIFRTVHSIKGVTGFLGFLKLGAIAHVGESLLSRLRDGILVINPPITSGLLNLVDCMRQILASIEATGLEGDVDCAVLLEELTSLRDDDQTQEATSVSPDVSLKTSRSASEETNNLAGPTKSETKSPNGNGEGPGALLRPSESTRTTLSGGNIRIDVKQLDVLMNLVGELVLTRNEVLQFSSTHRDSVLLSASQRLNLITTELHEGIMKARMQPISNVWNKFPRVVRDLALQGHKRVRLEMDGKETELDKALVEAITDPLLHLVRNAIDHGLEVPAARIAAGKPEECRLLLRAFHEGGQVNVEISDDGAGIDLPHVKRKALERGLITAEQARHMDEQEVTNLIFVPGFSTADNVTNVSGRGVGMDVVRTNIEKIGGKVSVQSQQGLGTTVKIRIPLTLAIMPALIVWAGAGRYAIPQVSVVELVRLEGEEVEKGIEKIQRVPVYRLRGDLLPLIWLDAELTLGTLAPDGRTEEDDAINIVVIQADDHRFGLVVDKVENTQEIVVKPLGKQLSGLSTFAGATIMGDGGVVLILDVLGLAVHSAIVSELREARTATVEMSAEESPAEREALLLVVGPDDGRMAIPLHQVTRLEEFLSSSIELAGGQQVVQYRGGTLHLVNISTLLPERRRQRRKHPRPEASETIQTIVYSKAGRSVGVVVDRIIDTIDQGLADLRPASRTGALSTVVIQGRVTEVLDLDVLCAGLTFSALPEEVLIEGTG